MANSTAPRVSLALPLYKSRRFLEIILENLETLAYPNLEILISDRHCADNAIDILQARFGSDARFQFFRARDEINWVGHYNFLLQAATGKYFFWMPHDDSYPREYIRVLVETLQKQPGAVLAYGRVETLHADAETVIAREIVDRPNETSSLTRSAFRMFLNHELWLAVRGIFDREFVIREKLFMRATLETNSADILWLFALACCGRIVKTTATDCRKRFYASSTHAQWTARTWPHTRVEYAILRQYLGAAKTPTERLRAEIIALVWAMLRLGGLGLSAAQPRNSLDNQIRKFLFKLNL